MQTNIFIWKIYKSLFNSAMINHCYYDCSCILTIWKMHLNTSNNAENCAINFNVTLSATKLKRSNEFIFGLICKVLQLLSLLEQIGNDQSKCAEFVARAKYSTSDQLSKCRNKPMNMWWNPQTFFWNVWDMRYCCLQNYLPPRCLSHCHWKFFKQQFPEETRRFASKFVPN